MCDTAFEMGRKKGFKEALERVNIYANCIAGYKGETCKWFAQNCQTFVVNGEKENHKSEPKA